MSAHMSKHANLSGPAAILATMDNCTKCGICQTVCPVAAVTPLFPGPKVAGPQSERYRAIESVQESSSTLCSGCGVCTSVCPNDVAITDIITIAKAASAAKAGPMRLGQRFVNRPDLLGAIGGLVAPLANALLARRFVRKATESLLGISARAALPRFRGRAFRRWLAKRRQPEGPVIGYFQGCAVEHYEPRVGMAVVGLLNHLGYRVEAPVGQCCGLPMLSTGEWDAARHKARRVMDGLAPTAMAGRTIVASSTSCSLTLRKKYEAYLDMRDPASAAVARQVSDICEFLRELPAEALHPLLKPLSARALYHGPCQLRSHQMGWPAVELLKRIDGLDLELSQAVCCGTAGTYGYDRDKRDIAEAVGATLMDQIRASRPDFVICDSETCRWHIAAETKIPCFHPVEILLASIEGAIR